MRIKLSLIGSVLALSFLTSSTLGASPEPGVQAFQPSKQGMYRVSMVPDKQPVQVGQVHEWTLTLMTAAGQPVDGATIRVGGGMPAHGHGLPTQPEVSKRLGQGRYTIGGMKFNMPGSWEITLDVDAKSGADRFSMPLTIPASR